MVEAVDLATKGSLFLVFTLPNCFEFCKQSIPDGLCGIPYRLSGRVACSSQIAGQLRGDGGGLGLVHSHAASARLSKGNGATSLAPVHAASLDRCDECADRHVINIPDQ